MAATGHGGIVGSVAYATRVDAAEDGFTCTRFPGRTVRFGPDTHIWPAFRWWRGMPEVVIDDGTRRMAVPWLVLQSGPGAVALKALKQGRNIENEDPYPVSEHEGAGVPAAAATGTVTAAALAGVRGAKITLRWRFRFGSATVS